MTRARVVNFPEPWRFKYGPRRLGRAGEVVRSQLDDSQWGTMRTDVKDKGYGKDMGVGWYRAQLPLIERNRDAKFKHLYFGACDEQT